jgi:hypothetical protein
MGGGEPIDAPADSMHFAPPDPVGGTVWGETSVGRSFCPKPVAEGVDWGDMQVAWTPRRLADAAAVAHVTRSSPNESRPVTGGGS